METKRNRRVRCMQSLGFLAFPSAPQNASAWREHLGFVPTGPRVYSPPLGHVGNFPSLQYSRMWIANGVLPLTFLFSSAHLILASSKSRRFATQTGSVAKACCSNFGIIARLVALPCSA